MFIIEISLSISFLLIGFFWGRRSKLKQFHRLQDEGLLTVEYHPQRDPTKEEEARKVRELLYQDEEEAQIPIPLRNFNWAQKMKDEEDEEESVEQNPIT